MTHRRLFLWLFSICTVLLVVTWGFSLVQRRGVTYDWPARSFTVSIGQGSLITEFKRDERPTGFRGGVRTSRQRIRRWDSLDSLDSLGLWGWSLGSGRTVISRAPAAGSAGGVPAAVPPPLTIPFTIRTLTIPLWAWWLVFVGLSYGVCRLLERKTATGKVETQVGAPEPDRPASDPVTEKPRGSLAMTYRRIFILLLLASTAVTGVQWARSIHHPSRSIYTPAGAPFTLLAFVRTGTVTVEWHSEGNLRPSTYDPSLVGPKANRMGRFGFERTRTEPRSGPSVTSIRVDFPIWLRWLLFNAAAFGILRWMERRAARGKNKAPVEQSLSAANTGEPA